MATDVEARDSSNSAMVIALVVIGLLVVGAVAYFGFGNRVVETPGSTTIVTPPSGPDVNVQVPSPPVVVGGGSGGGTSGGGTSSGGTSGGTSGSP